MDVRFFVFLTCLLAHHTVVENGTNASISDRDGVVDDAGAAVLARIVGTFRSIAERSFKTVRAIALERRRADASTRSAVLARIRRAGVRRRTLGDVGAGARVVDDPEFVSVEAERANAAGETDNGRRNGIEAG